MIPVILESPYSGEVGRNKLYLQACIRDCLARNESPYASHQMLTEALDERHNIERQIGIDAALPWYESAHKQVVYTDFGISGGMKIGIERFSTMRARDAVVGARTEYRSLGGIWWTWGRMVVK